MPLSPRKANCPRCDVRVGPYDQYCGRCGQRLVPVPCPACALVAPPEEFFCAQCGSALPGATPADTPVLEDTPPSLPRAQGWGWPTSRISTVVRPAMLTAKPGVAFAVLSGLVAMLALAGFRGPLGLAGGLILALVALLSFVWSVRSPLH